MSKIENLEEEENLEEILENLNDYFKLPIYYNHEKMNLKENIINDLELIKTVDSSCNPIYKYFCNNNNILSDKITEQISEYYTTDINFLKDNQQLLKNLPLENLPLEKVEPKTNLDTKTHLEPKTHLDTKTHLDKYDKILKIWDDIKSDTGFKEKYYYMDWEHLEFLNKSEHFLQFMSIYNIASPVISFFIPIIILIIPFFVIKLKGLNLNINEYIEILKTIISQTSIGKLFTEFNQEVSINQKIYILVSAGFYLFSIYQNILVCIRFNDNMIKIHTYFKEIKEYLNNTINSMEIYLKYSSNLLSHKEFNTILNEKKLEIVELNTKLSYITNYTCCNYKKVFEIGYVLKHFYEIYESDFYKNLFMYSFGFNGYIDCIKGIQTNIKERKINFSNFINKKKKNKIINNYYGPLNSLLKDTILDNKDLALPLEKVDNDINLNKNLIITGPNASGKTTILKSTLINIILTQQFGCGFYNSAQLKPYKFIHCYLNIPDTSGRDSLFQAEARRCKEIIDIINNNKKDDHFCVFDELYSGTNPDDAIVSATAFMEYLVKNKNVTSILTTHFIKVCKNLNTNKNLLNCMMESYKTENKMIYTYLLKPGISEIKGGCNILHDMNYPKEILEKL